MDEEDFETRKERPLGKAWIPFDQRCAARSSGSGPERHICGLMRRHKGEHECDCCREWWSDDEAHDE